MPSAGLRPALLKAAGLVTGIGGAVALVWGSGLDRFLTSEALGDLTAGLGVLAPVAFFGIKIVAIVLASPAAPLSLLGGALFGPLLGTVVNFLAALTGASITFFLGRAFGRDLSERLLRGRLRELDLRIADGGFWLVVFLRLVPLFPFNGINYGSGLTRLSFRDYFAGSAIGMIPGTAAYTLLGHAAASRSGPIVALALGGLGLLALIPLAARAVKARSGSSSPRSHDEAR